MQPADARVREIGKQALSGPFAGMEASLVEVSYLPGRRSPTPFLDGKRAQRLAEREIGEPRVVHRLHLAHDLLALSKQPRQRTGEPRYAIRFRPRGKYSAQTLRFDVVARKEVAQSTGVSSLNPILNAGHR